jgi:hypothetical protein
MPGTLMPPYDSRRVVGSAVAPPEHDGAGGRTQRGHDPHDHAGELPSSK